MFRSTSKILFSFLCKMKNTFVDELSRTPNNSIDVKTFGDGFPQSMVWFPEIRIVKWRITNHTPI
jgi:hypothetical protein